MAREVPNLAVSNCAFLTLDRCNVPLRTHSLQDPRIPFALASNKYRLAPPRTSDRCTRILHPLALHLHDRETNTERLCATAAPPRHSRHSASPRMTTPESRQGLESPAAMTTDEHEWLPTRTPSTDDAVSSSVSRSTAAEKRTNSEIREKRNVSMADDAHTVNGEGEDGRDARRANRRGSRQTSGHSFERPPLKKRLVSCSCCPPVTAVSAHDMTRRLSCLSPSGRSGTNRPWRHPCGPSCLPAGSTCSSCLSQ